VIDNQANDWDYPRISGLRGKASALYALGQIEVAREWFERCRVVAETRDVRTLLREVATLAIGDLLARNEGSHEPHLGNFGRRASPVLPSPSAFAGEQRPTCTEQSMLRSRVKRGYPPGTRPVT
jgi:hypothetical protein